MVNFRQMLRNWLSAWLGIAALRQSSSELLNHCNAEATRLTSAEEQIAQLRAIITTRPKPPVVQQARSWSQAKRLMGDMGEGDYAN